MLIRTLPGVRVALMRAVPASAQTLNTGSVAGVVFDRTGVAGAAAELQDEATQAVRSAHEVGCYVFVGTPPGAYTVRATAPGFKPAQMPSVVVEVSKSYNINMQS